jgi:hypothetical protein
MGIPPLEELAKDPETLKTFLKTCKQRPVYRLFNDDAPKGTLIFILDGKEVFATVPRYLRAHIPKHLLREFPVVGKIEGYTQYGEQIEGRSDTLTISGTKYGVDVIKRVYLPPKGNGTATADRPHGTGTGA